MKETKPTLEQWRQLHAVAVAVKALAPWDWMNEADLFAVEDPASGQMGYVNVMGAIGEHFAVAVYLGGAGLRGFMAMQHARESDMEELFFAVPQLQASFEGRESLRSEDRDIVKALGLKFRGRNDWPLFRSYRPGYFPWHLSAEEASFLIVALEQVLDVAPRFRADASLFYGQDVEGLLVRAASSSAPDAAWVDRRQAKMDMELEPLAVTIEERMLNKLAALPPGKGSIEIDLFRLPSPVREGNGRPYFIYNLLFVDGESGFVYGFELLRVETTLEAMWAKVPELVTRHLFKSKTKPRAIMVRPGLMPGMIEPIASYCGIPLKQSKRLRMLDPAREGLMSSLF